MLIIQVYNPWEAEAEGDFEASLDYIASSRLMCKK